MARSIPERLMTERVTVRRPVQSFISGTKRPVFEHEVIATNVRARMNPGSTALERNVLGQTPRQGARVFINLKDLPPGGLKENYEVTNEITGETFVVTEVKNFFDHHFEAMLSERKA
jgi:hypothetical protein